MGDIMFAADHRLVRDARNFVLDFLAFAAIVCALPYCALWAVAILAPEHIR